MDIVLRVKKAEDLFYKSVIPLSCKRLIHPDVEEFIIEEAESFQKNTVFNLVIHITEESSITTSEIISIIQFHFANLQKKQAIN